MRHQRQDGIGFGRDHHIITRQPEPLAIVAQIGRQFRLEQADQRGRAPVLAGDVIMRRRQRGNPPAQDRGKAGHAQCLVLGLRDQPADQAEDIAHPVVQFRDQQVLLLRRAGAFAGQVFAHAQDHFDQRAAQAGGDFAFVCVPITAVTAHDFGPGGKAGTRLQHFARHDCGLGRIARPGDAPFQRAAPQHQTIAGAARQRQHQRPGGAVGKRLGIGDLIGQPGGGMGRPAQRVGQQRGDGAEFGFVRGGTACAIIAIDEQRNAIMRDGAAHHFLDQRQAVGQRQSACQPQQQPVIQLPRLFAQFLGPRDQNAVEHQ